MNACPSDFSLEESLIDPDSIAAHHAASCESCTRRLGEMEVQRQLFHRVIRANTLDSILARAERPSVTRRWQLWLAPLLTAAAVGGFLLAKKPTTEPPPETEHSKGSAGNAGAKAPPSPLVLTIFAGREGIVHPVADGDRIPANAELRFRVGTPEACWLTIASLDDKGAVSHLYPAGAPAHSLSGGSADLQGGARLDGLPGSERIFAVCSPAPMGEETLNHAIRTSGAHGPLALPDGTVQSTLLVLKAP